MTPNTDEDYMERNSWLFRLFFLCIASVASLLLLMGNGSADGFAALAIKSSIFGLATVFCMLAVEYFIKKISFRTFNSALAGLFIGTVIGTVVSFSVRELFSLLDASTAICNIATLYSFLGSIYLGITLTSASNDDWWLNIPFVRLAPAAAAKKNALILDISALEDIRLIELARCGLLDHQLIVPTFVIEEIQHSLESLDENMRLRARRCQEHLKRLESMEQLALEVKEFHFSNSEELSLKLVRACKLTQGYLLSAQEPSQLKADDDLLKTISLDTVAAALKPGAQRGEILSIKIQRLGKEPKQGVGYLDDGAMVVVNGGGEFLGQTIRTQVLSQKYSSSGKIIFCNALTHDEKGVLRPACVEGSPYHLTYQ